MRMLYPETVEPVDPAAVYSDLPHSDGRPAVRLNMIVSVDGGTSWGGVSGALGGPADPATQASYTGDFQASGGLDADSDEGAWELSLLSDYAQFTRPAAQQATDAIGPLLVSLMNHECAISSSL
jgi:hypothetical protein